jgi:V-type H+-transporting ATPase subunit E
MQEFCLCLNGNDETFQGFLRLKEPSVLLRCRENDVDLVNEILEDAKKEYFAKSGADSIEVQVDEKIFLPPAQDLKNTGKFWY